MIVNLPSKPPFVAWRAGRGGSVPRQIERPPYRGEDRSIGSGPWLPRDAAVFVAEFRSGAKAFLTRLIDTCDPSLRSFIRHRLRCARDVEDDVAQETWLMVLEHRTDFRGGEGPVLPAFRSWLRRLAATACRRWLAANAGTYALDGRDEVSAGSGAEDALIARITIDECLTRLTPRERRAVQLHHVEGLSEVQTASLMACQTGTVKALLFKARARLRNAALNGLPRRAPAAGRGGGRFDAPARQRLPLFAGAI